MKTFLSFCIFYLLLTTFIFAQKPNIILIMTDDLGWCDVGFNGNTEILTPNIDELANQGLILDRFYSASAVCSPTRASLLTGRNPLRMNIPTANAGFLPQKEVTIPELLKPLGYATGHYGKWHLGTLTKLVPDGNRGGKVEHFDKFSIPSMHGYDEWSCTESKVPTYDPMIKPKTFEEGEGLRYGWKALENRESEEYGTAYWFGKERSEVVNLDGDDSKIIIDRAIPFIENSLNNNKPFFTTLWFHTPHLPVVADKEHRDLFSQYDLDKQIYYGTIKALDEQIGRLWDKLGELGQQENTMIWFCSDNGPERQTPGTACDFRERKRSLYEGGVRVPAFVIWKGKWEGGERIGFPMSTSDYLPTIVDILNLKYPDKRPLDGMSLVKAVEGKQNKRKKDIGFLFRNKASWVTHQYKLITTNEGESYELYDLLNDRYEGTDIIAENEKLAARLKKKLDKWKLSVRDSQRGEDY